VATSASAAAAAAAVKPKEARFSARNDHRTALNVQAHRPLISHNAIFVLGRRRQCTAIELEADTWRRGSPCRWPGRWEADESASYRGTLRPTVAAVV